MLPHLDLFAIVLSTGLVYLLLALTVWTLLWRRHPTWQLVPWSLGSVAMGLALLLFSARGHVPGWATYELCNSLLFASLVLRVMALRLDLGLPGRGAAAVAVWLLSSVVYAVLVRLEDPAPRNYFSSTVALIGTAILAFRATQLGHTVQSRAAYLLAGAEWMLCAVLVVRLGAMTGSGSPVRLEVPSWYHLLLFVTLGATALYGNLGYMGMVLDRSRLAELKAQAERLTESNGRLAAEGAAAELRMLLDERDRLAGDRRHLLEVLAHEIRQPVHNVGGALRAAAAALKASPACGIPQIADPLQQAQEVLGGMQAVLDNSLAATVLLSRAQPLLRQETELDFITALALGDLATAQRARVRVSWQTTLRSAEIEPNLARLALRNLLHNAFSHGGAQVNVELRIGESAQPPRLLLAVADDGVALDDRVLQRLSETAGDPSRPPARNGLGLFIASRVMALHGGELTLAAQQPRGLVATLAFPLPADEA